MTTFGSVCSGIEAASVAWDLLGWRASWFAEIEKWPSKLLAVRWPHVPNLGDMTQLALWVDLGLIEAPDVLVGGTPCQAFSVAGLRNSLSDERGQLSLAFIGLANAIDRKRAADGKQKCVIVWENVPGVLSTKDNAFGCFLAGLAGESDPLQPTGGKWSNAGCVYGPERTIAWRVLDAQYFGVAQRRRRVFVVASARDGFDPSEVLFEFDGVRRDIAPSRETGQKVADLVATSVGKCDEDLTVTYAMSAGGGNTCNVSPTLDCRVKNGPMQSQTALGILSANRMVAFGEYVDDGTASTMKARDYKDATDLVAYGIQANIIGRQDHNGGNGLGFSEAVSPTLTKSDRHAVAHITPTLTSNSDSHTGFRDEHGLVVEEVRPINTMTVQGRPSDDENPRMGSGIDEHGDPGNTLTKGHSHGVFTSHNMAVRRLTPTECERLQGFPDNYTLIDDKTPDGSRYKALGNSMAVPVMRWIGERIKLALDMDITDYKGE